MVRIQSRAQSRSDAIGMAFLFGSVASLLAKANKQKRQTTRSVVEALGNPLAGVSGSWNKLYFINVIRCGLVHILIFFIKTFALLWLILFSWSRPIKFYILHNNCMRDYSMQVRHNKQTFFWVRASWTVQYYLLKIFLIIWSIYPAYNCIFFRCR